MIVGGIANVGERSICPNMANTNKVQMSIVIALARRSRILVAPTEVRGPSTATAFAVVVNAGAKNPECAAMPEHLHQQGMQRYAFGQRRCPQYCCGPRLP